MKKIVGLTLILFTICFSNQAFPEAAYQLSMLPRYSFEEINKRITPLAAYLSKKTGIAIEPVFINNFSQYEKQLNTGSIGIGYENPYIYILVSKSHEVVAMTLKGEGKDKFRGIIIVKADSDIVAIDDLKGKRISIVAKSSACGFLSQKLTMLEHGLNVEKDCTITEAIDNKQENVIFAVYTGDADAGFIRESALNRIDKFVPPAMIRVINQSAWLPNWALSVSRSMPEEKKEAIKKALIDLKENDPVLKALKIIKFRPAADKEYDSIRKASGMTIPKRN